MITSPFPVCYLKAHSKQAIKNCCTVLTDSAPLSTPNYFCTVHVCVSLVESFFKLKKILRPLCVIYIPDTEPAQSFSEDTHTLSTTQYITTLNMHRQNLTYQYKQFVFSSSSPQLPGLGGWLFWFCLSRAGVLINLIWPLFALAFAKHSFTFFCRFAYLHSGFDRLVPENIKIKKSSIHMSLMFDLSFKCLKSFSLP